MDLTLGIGSALADSHDDDRAIGVLESLLVAYPQSASIPGAKAHRTDAPVNQARMPREHVQDFADLIGF